MKTATSYRSALHAPAVESLAGWKARQAKNRYKAGYECRNIRLVFGTRYDTVMSKDNVRRRLHALCDKLEIPRMRPSETRKTFVSIMSALGGSEELIADICGHTTTVTTRRVYRDELRPVITGGADLIGQWFANGKS